MAKFIKGSPGAVMYEATRYVLKEKKAFNVVLEIEPDVRDYDEVTSIFDSLYSDKVLARFGVEVPFSYWLVDVIWPMSLYNLCDSIEEMIQLEEFYYPPSSNFRKHNGNIFGQAARERKVFDGTSYDNWIDYLLKRWKNNRQRPMPHFYFDVVHPEWVFEQLILNDKLVRAQRTCLACIMNISFRYCSKKKQMAFTMILKHNQWSHLIGDVYGAALAALAFNKEFGIENPPHVVVDLMSSTMDDVKVAKLFLEKMNKEYWQK